VQHTRYQATLLTAALVWSGCSSKKDAAAEASKTDAAADASGAMVTPGADAPPVGTTVDAKLAADKPPPVLTGETFVVIAAGDIGDSNLSKGKQNATATLIGTIIGQKNVRAVLPLGDLAYFNGSTNEFKAHYDPFWGRPEIRPLSRPVPGNHEYIRDSSATGYFDYWNGAGQDTGIAGERGKGYYSYDIGAWHFVALNTNGSTTGCSNIPCNEGSAQLTWLKADLAANQKKCTLAYWHHPRFNQSTRYGDLKNVASIWTALYDAHADVTVHGHEHNYQQFRPADKTGAHDPDAGVRSFIVGTGGIDLLYQNFDNRHADTLEYKNSESFGVLELTLAEAAYSWRFVTTSGSVLVTGSDACR
jgi:hypothetical protein